MNKVFPLMLALFLSLATAGLAAERHVQKIIIRGDDAFAPFEYLDENHQPAGFDIDIARAVAEVTDLTVELSLGPWDEVRRELETGKIDALAGMRFSEERDRLLDFSNPYLINSSAIFVRSGSKIDGPEDLNGKQIIVQKGDIMDDLIREITRTGSIVLVDNQDEALKMLAAGEYDAALCSRLRGLYLKQKYRLDNLTVVGPELAGGPYGFAVAEGDTLLLAKLNEGLRILRATGRYQEIYQQWFGLYEQRSITRELLRYAIWVLTPILVLLGLAMTWSWTLKRQVAIKTRELNKNFIEKRQVEERLNAEKRFRQFVDASPVPMMILSEQCILYVNRMFTELFGYTLAELSDAETWWALACPDPTRRKAVLDRWYELFEPAGADRRAEEDPWETDITCRDGTLRHVIYRLASIDDHHLIVFNDITIRKQAEEALTQRARMEAVISNILTRFVNLPASELDVEINRALQELCTVIGVDRCYVFQFNGDGTIMHNTHEWCADGIEPHIGRLQNLSTADFNWYLQQLDAHGMFYCPSVDALGPDAEAEKREWQLEGIRSLITVPMLREGEMVGFVGFDSVRHERHWPEEVPFMLRIVGESFASALERRRFEQELRAAHQHLLDIIDFLPDATFVVDRNGVVVAWNRAVEELTGIAKEQMLGNGDFAYAEPLFGERRPTLADLIRTPEILPVLDNYEVLKQEGRSLYAEQHLPALNDGQGAYVWAKASPLFNREGELIGAIETIRDISEHREARDKLETSNREMEAFVYTVSHDLRSPLTPIIGYAQLLKDLYRDNLDAKAIDFLTEIETQGEKMAALMEDLLTLAKVGELEGPSGQVDVNRVVEEVCQELAHLIREADTEVRKDELPSCRVPRTLLTLIFTNLIANALRYGAGPGAAIEVGGDRREQSVRYFVRDHGPGIPEEERRSVFDLFFRGTAGKALSGTGVGLATVKKIVGKYDGDVRVEATPGGGATFWVEMKDR